MYCSLELFLRRKRIWLLSRSFHFPPSFGYLKESNEVRARKAMMWCSIVVLFIPLTKGWPGRCQGYNYPNNSRRALLSVTGWDKNLRHVSSSQARSSFAELACWKRRRYLTNGTVRVLQQYKHKYYPEYSLIRRILNKK